VTVKRQAVQGIRPEDCAPILSDSLSLRRRDIDIILIFIGFRTPDGDKDYFLGGGYYYNFNDRNALGVRVAYAEKKSEFYQSQSRYFEVSYRLCFQKSEKKFAWTLSSGPWMQIFTGQHRGIYHSDSLYGTIGLATNGGLHYYIVPRFSVGIVGLTMLEVFTWELGKAPAFYPLITPGIGVQLAYAW